MLTKLEDQIMMSILHFGDQAYGVNIYEHLAGIIETKMAIGVVYANLDRLIRKGLLESYLGEKTAVRGGMAKKYYRLTPCGYQALESSKKVHDQIWASFDTKIVGGKGR